MIVSCQANSNAWPRMILGVFAYADAYFAPGGFLDF
jgi:hypothetical protein